MERVATDGVYLEFYLIVPRCVSKLFILHMSGFELLHEGRLYCRDTLHITEDGCSYEAGPLSCSLKRGMTSASMESFFFLPGQVILILAEKS